MYQELSQREEHLASEIVDIAIRIHKKLGPGLLEIIYEKCFCYELERRGIKFKSQEPAPIFYDDMEIDNGLRIDILVDELVIIELKAHEGYHAIWEAQLLSYLKLTELRLGFIINFNNVLIKNGIKRRIL